jgi:hypothetical protein
VPVDVNGPEGGNRKRAKENDDGLEKALVRAEPVFPGEVVIITSNRSSSRRASRKWTKPSETDPRNGRLCLESATGVAPECYLCTTVALPWRCRGTTQMLRNRPPQQGEGDFSISLG